MDIEIFANEQEEKKSRTERENTRAIFASMGDEELPPQLQSREGYKITTTRFIGTIKDFLYHQCTSVEDAQNIIENIIKEIQSMGYQELITRKLQEQERFNSESILCYMCGTTGNREIFLRPTNLYKHRSNMQYHCEICIEKVKEEYICTCAFCGHRYSPEFNVNRSVCSSCKTEATIAQFALVSKHNARAHEMGLPATLTLRQWIDTVNHFNKKCAYCFAPFDTLEHFLPLSLQGGTTVNNCVPSCKRCNVRKLDRHPDTLDRLFPSDTLARIRTYLASMSNTQESE